MNEVIGAGLAAGDEAGAKESAAELLQALAAIRRVARRAVRQAAHTDPLPPARSELLRLAAANPGISVAEAAHELGLAPNSVSTLVGKLTADGLLVRSRGEADGRSAELRVTEAGAARISQWRDLRADLGGRALQRLSPQDQRAIMAALPALTRLSDAMAEQMETGTPTQPTGQTERP